VENIRGILDKTYFALLHKFFQYDVKIKAVMLEFCVVKRNKISSISSNFNRNSIEISLNIQTYTKPIHSATTAGFSSPLISIVTPYLNFTLSSFWFNYNNLNRPRILESTGTILVKRILSKP